MPLFDLVILDDDFDALDERDTLVISWSGDE